MFFRQYATITVSSFCVCFSIYAHELDTFIVDVPGEVPNSESGNVPITESSAGIEAGEQLRTINGVSAGRKGGKGFEPVIRGQQQSQLNILLGNARVLGACPGRMDPPTSYVSPAGYDRIRVIKGYESVIYGSGGSGGSILYERDIPEFGINNYIGKLGAGYRENVGTFSTLGDVAFGSRDGYVRTYGGYTDAGNYQDGDGNTVSSAYRSVSGGLVLAGNILEHIHVDANVESTRDRDILYSGNGMDAPYANADLWRLKINVDQVIGWVDEQELSLYYTDLHHLMDNYSVRRRSKNSTGLRSPSTSKTKGGRWLGTLCTQNIEWQLGVDYFNNQRNAERYKTNLETSEQSHQATMWPGVEYSQWGLFVEMDHGFSDVDHIRLGGRVDWFSADAGKANEPSLGAANPNELYQKYYGYEAERVDETNVSGLLNWQHKLTHYQWLEFRGSRSVRTADATERYLASRGSCCHGSDDWVGNPKIKPEKHHQFDVGYYYNNNVYAASTVAYIDEVSDYILRYKSSNGPYLYRNTDARIYGVEFETSANYGAWKPALGLNWTRGINRSATGNNDKNLPQIPALLATIRLDYEVSDWGVGSRCEFAASQDKLNTNSGLDSGVSSGFGVCHLSAHYQFNSQVNLHGGVENLFNKTYAWHINKRSRDPFNPDASVVNEPGRMVWLGVDVSF